MEKKINLRNCKSIVERRRLLEKIAKFNFKAVSVYPKALQEAQFHNCENMIGAIQLPLGVAGPLKLKGEMAVGDFYLPLATSEGALVASVNRGCKAITLSGGASVCQQMVGITRSAVFKTKGLAQSLDLQKWLEGNILPLKKITKKTSSHLSLLKIETNFTGKNIYLRFYFDPSDAMGMNMATIAVTKLASYIEEKKKVACLSVASNFDTDKKPSWLNFILGRGRKIWAEAVLSERIVKSVLKTTPKRIHQLSLSKCYLGSIMSGSLGFNAHFANIIAAFFIATGQDVAHVVEGSLGVTTTEIVADSLYISIYLPDLPVGVIGGGTGLPSQKEALRLLSINIKGQGEAASCLAEIVAGAVLAGEISLLASLAEGSLAAAHQKLARGNTIV